KTRLSGLPAARNGGPMARRTTLLPSIALVLALACGGEERPPAAAPRPPEAAARPAQPPASTAPDDLPYGLLVALSPFEVGPDGKVRSKPTAARLEIVTRERGAWRVRAIEDPESNVFHKALAYDGGILTLGGTAAAIKLWRPDLSGTSYTSETIWTRDFGGKFSRMRDAELADLDGDGPPELVVATHDQGIVAVVRRDPAGGWKVEEIDAEKDTFVHEIEIGDLDGDGVPEVYAT